MTRRNMEMANILAIDFGTTNSYFSKCPADQISPVGIDFGTGRDGLPTAILYRGDREPLVGEPALHEYGEASPAERTGYQFRTQFKPDIVESPEAAQAATDFLRVVVQQAQRQHIALDPTKYDVIFGVPSESREAFRTKLSHIARTAGYGDVRLIDEPKGALLHHLWHKDFSPEEARRGILVIDFGGGTCDFALLQSLQVTQSWGDMELGGRLFDDLFFQWFIEQDRAALRAMEKAGDTYYVHSYLCREVKEFFSLTMARDRAETVNKSIGRYGSLRGMTWDGFLDRARHYVPSATFLRHLQDMGLRIDGLRITEGRLRSGTGASDPPSEIRNPKPRSVDLIEWFRTSLAHGLAEKDIDTGAISRVILAGGSSQWPFVPDVVTETLGVERSCLMRSDRPYAVIAQGLSILPSLQKRFDEARARLRSDLPEFSRTRVRPLVERVTDNYVAGVAADVTSELFDKAIRPVLEEFRKKGGSTRALRESIDAEVKVHEARVREIVEDRMLTLRRGLPGQLNEMLKAWFESYGLSVGEKPIREAHQVSAAQEMVQPIPPDLYGGIMEMVGWFVVALAASVGGAVGGGGGLALLAAGPAGWIAGAVLSAVVAFLAARYGITRAREMADTWNAPAWLAKSVLLSSRIARMRTDFQQRLRETLRRETGALQDQLEEGIAQVTETQIESLSEVAQL
ncbi:MAG: Hsp70 family protein [Sedimentisphaerales bacterium]|nr:Hsp70 family protein [Sedimentisphaerales bacterium]